ncbi:MAG: hypothetical protein HYS23_11470 [Geobacter sp.]|nr:hypothetical protein [Geobacter sp.]
MKLIFFIVMAGTLALLSGCATIGDTQVPTAATGDGTIRQIREFKDLTIEEQEVILHGG